MTAYRCSSYPPSVTFFARDKLTYAASGGQAYSVVHSIGDLEQRLDPKRFIRIHRSTLLNIGWIEEMHSRFGGQTYVTLKDPQHTRLAVARDRVRVLKDQLEL